MRPSLFLRSTPASNRDVLSRGEDCSGDKTSVSNRKETKAFLDSKKYLWDGFAACLAILDQGEGFLGDFQIIRFPRQENSIFDCFSFLSRILR